MKVNPRNLLLPLLGFSLPNVILSMLALYLGVSRPFLNVDYAIWALLFLFTPLYLSLPLLLLVFFIDILVVLGQIFPIFRLEDAFYLLNFIHLAPGLYKAGIACLFILFVITAALFFKIKTSTPKEVMLISINVFVLSYIAQVFILDIPENNRLWRMRSSDFIGSQIVYNIDSRGDGFVLEFHNTGEPFEITHFERASDKLFKQPSASNKILLIVAESWGSTLPEISDAVIAPLLKKQANYQVFSRGETSFLGATVAAEFKELCGLKPRHFNMKKTVSGFEHCLPNQLKTKGYVTKGIHGAAGTMYDRAYWYPKAGFEQTTFLESEPRNELCYSFPGACDRELFDETLNFFSNNQKGFMYWLTLNTHSPYDKRDIKENVFNCGLFSITENSELCRHFKLHAQFFNGLAHLLDNPAMKGVDIVIVGDHQPPISDDYEREHYFKKGYVSWLRIKI